MNIRFWKYVGGIGITGTLMKVPGTLFLIFYWAFALLGFLAIAAFIYALL